MTENVRNMTLEERVRLVNNTYKTFRRAGIIKTWTEFAEILPTNRQVLSSARNGNEKYLTDNLMEKCLDALESLNEHNRYVSVENSPGTNIVNGNNNNVEISGGRGLSALAAQHQNVRCVPTIPIHAYRAINFDVMQYFRDTNDDLRMSPIVMQFPGTDCYYFVNSDDMTPHLQMNDLLCLSRLPQEARVTNGDICILNTKYQGMLERFVYDDGDYLILKASQPRWTDMRIPKEEIFHIFRILGGIRTNI